MKLRNKMTGEVKDVTPEQALAMGVPEDQINQSGGMMSKASQYAPLLLGLLGGTGGFLAGGPPGAVAGGAAGYAGGSAISRASQPVQPYMQPSTMGDKFTEDASNSAGMGLGMGALAELFGIGKMFAAGGPKKYLQGKYDTAIEKAGNPEITAEQRAAKFGTLEQPNVEMTKGLSSASNRDVLVNELKKEILNQGLTNGESMNPTVTAKDLLDLRKGAYASKYDKLVPKPLQDLYGKMGLNYKQLLNESVPETAKIDKQYAMVSNITSGGQKAVATTKRLLPYIIIADLYRRLKGSQ